MDQDTIIASLDAFDFDALREALSVCPPPPDGEPTLDELIDSTLLLIGQEREHLRAIIAEVDDPTDVAMALAIQYVELKSRWIGLNTKINYETFRKGHAQTRDMLRAAATSNFLGHLENVLEPDDIDKITEFLAEPINKAA